MKDWVVQNVSWVCPLIITLMFSVVNAIIAICNIHIIKKQMKIQNDSFCFQLYEKRFAVYSVMNEVLLSVGTDGRITDINRSKFRDASNDAIFMFDQDMIEFCYETKKLLSELRTIGMKVEYNNENKIRNEEHFKLCDREDELITKISEKREHLSKIMKKYISFAKYKIKI